MYDLLQLRREFPVLSRCIYLDSASTSQTPKRSVDAMCEYFYEYAANHGRGAHHLARKTTEQYEVTREKVARFLHVRPDQIVFTKNTTDALNMVAKGITWRRGDEIITTMLEHHSNLLPWMMLRKKGVRVTIIPHTGGYIDPQAVAGALSARTRLVTVSHMPNVLGTLQPVGEIGEITRDAGISLVVDGAQSVGHVPFDISNIDYMAIPGHKGLLGPQGTGILYMNDNESLECSVYGGGMVESVSHTVVKLLPPPAKYEPGTPNIPGVIGLGPAIDLVMELGVEEIHRHETALGARMFDGLAAIPGVDVYSPRGTGVVSFNVNDIEPDRFARMLDDYRKICVRSGMHCAEPLASLLHPLGTLRASVGCYSTPEEVDALIESVSALAKTA